MSLFYFFFVPCARIMERVDIPASPEMLGVGTIAEFNPHTLSMHRLHLAPVGR